MDVAAWMHGFFSPSDGGDVLRLLDFKADGWGLPSPLPFFSQLAGSIMMPLCLYPFVKHSALKAREFFFANLDF